MEVRYEEFNRAIRQVSAAFVRSHAAVLCAVLAWMQRRAKVSSTTMTAPAASRSSRGSSRKRMDGPSRSPRMQLSAANGGRFLQ